MGGSAAWAETVFYGYVVTPVACAIFPACFGLTYYIMANYINKSERFRNARSPPPSAALAADTRFQRLKVSDHIMSTMHAVIISLMGIFAVTTTYAAGDLIHSRSKLVRMFPFVITPYMLIDLVAMYWVAQAKGATFREFWHFRKLMIIHHLLLAAFVIPTLSITLNGRGDFFVGCYMLTEVPMIFLNIYQAFETIGLEFFPYQLLVALGVLANAGWFIFRVCIIPYMYWALSHFWHAGLWTTISRMPFRCHVANSIGQAFFLHWWLLIVKKTIESVVTFVEHNKQKPKNININGHATSSATSYQVPHIEPTLNTVGVTNAIARKKAV